MSSGTHPRQLELPNFMPQEEYVCPLCNQPARLFGQYSPLMSWGVCRECSIKYPYPDNLFIPSTRRNSNHEPLMIDPSPEKSAAREQRIVFEEMLRCAIDPSRIERPIVKYNINGLELRNPVRRSRMCQLGTMMQNARHSLTYRQVSLPTCQRCGCVHDRYYEMLPGIGDYYSKCQHCADEETVETLWRMRGIFGQDDDESILDRIYKSHPELFERGIMPDYWFLLKEKS